MRKFTATGLLLILPLIAGCQPIDYRAEEQFQNDQAGSRNQCVLAARQACEGASNVDTCVENHSLGCVSSVENTPDPYRESALPSGMEESFDAGETVLDDPEFAPLDEEP